MLVSESAACRWVSDGQPAESMIEIVIHIDSPDLS
jgi:hypothetical protein